MNFQAKLFLVSIGFLSLFHGKSLYSQEYEILSVDNAPKGRYDEWLPDFKAPGYLKKGKNVTSLKTNAVKLYNDFWLRILKEIPARNFVKAEQYRKSIPKKMNLKMVSTNIAVVEKPNLGLSELDDIAYCPDIWVLIDETWQPIPTSEIKFRKYSIVDLNSDGFKDIVLIGGCCDSHSIDIVINNRDETVKLQQNIVIIGIPDAKFVDNCKSSIEVTPYNREGQESKKLIFSCERNRFVPTP